MNKITIRVIISVLVILLFIPCNVNAQVPGMPSQEIMEFYMEWAIIAPLGIYIPALFAYNETLYEGEKVTSDECVKFDEAIGTIASVMKKACAGVKSTEIKKEMQLAAENYSNASKLYADYHKTGKEESKDKADKFVEVAGEHWEKVSEHLESMFGGG